MRLEGVLRRITALIVQSYDPKTIVLFGSYAKGQENSESDLDILVIGDIRTSRILLSQELRQLVYGFPIRIDLHFITPEEVKDEMRSPYGFLSSALASGVSLYSK